MKKVPARKRVGVLAGAGAVAMVVALLVLLVHPASAGTWHPRHSPTAKNLNAITFPTAQVGYAVGEGSCGGETSLLKTTDGGFSWQQAASIPPPSGCFYPNLKAVHFITEDLGFVGAGTIIPTAIWKTVDGGESWTLVFQTTEAGGTRPISGISFGTPTKGIAVGDLSGPPIIVNTSDGGDTWQQRTAPSGTGALSSVAMSGDRGIAVGLTSGSSQTASGKVLYTTNGGSTWTASSSTIPFPLKSVSIPPGSSGAAYAVGSNGQIVKSTDWGQTWSVQASGTASNLNAVAFINSNTGHAVGASMTFLETNDGGQTWVPNTGPDTQTTALNAVAFADSANRFAVGPAGRIFRYHPNDLERSSVSISDKSVVEGDEGQTDLVFTVSLSNPAVGPASIGWETTGEGTATPGQHYQASSGTLTFPLGTTSQSVTVTVIPNIFPESNRTVVVRLKDPSNLTINKGRGVGTITDDDTPSIRIADASIPEGNEGAAEATFAVSLNTPAQVEVTVDFTTVDGAATAGQDYQPVSGTLSFPPGVTSTVVNVPVFGDVDPEQDEIFYVDLSNSIPAAVPIARARASGVISNDDVLALISVADPDPGRIDEPDEGQTAQVEFAVSLEEPTSGTVTVDYATSDGTAVSGSTEPPAGSGVDYQAVSGTITFSPGVTSATVAVTINGDDLVEDHEALSFNLSNRSLNSNIVKASATAVIHDEDSVPARMTLAAVRRGVSVGVVDPEMGLMYVGNKVIDLATRNEIGTIGHSAFIQVVDEEKHRLFMIGGQVAVYEARTERSLPVLVASFDYPAGLTPQGATFYRGPGEERLYFLTHTEGGGPFNPDTYTTLLHQVNVTRLLNPGTIPFNSSNPNDYWTYHVAPCSRPLDGVNGRIHAAVARGGAYVSIACSPGFVFPSQTPGQQGVARVSLGPLGVPTHTEFFPLPGLTHRGDGIADQGSGRIFVLTNSGDSRADPVVWGFDPIRAAYVGSLSMPSPVLTMAIDQRSGNIFVVSEGSGAGGGPWSVRITDARAPALWPGVLETVKGDQQIQDAADPGAYDRVRRQLILPWSQGGQIYFKDALPDLIPPPEDELEPPYLVAEEEAEGLTDREYVGGTQAYGVKYRFVGGLGNDRAGSFLGPPLGFLGLGLSGQTREVTLAAVPTTALSNGEASARAVGADADDNTERGTNPWNALGGALSGQCTTRDPSGTSPFCPEGPEMAQEMADQTGNPLWSGPPAFCRDKGETGDPVEVASPNGRESVFCDKSNDQVSANAAYAGDFLAGAPVDAGSVRVATVSYLDEERGMVSRSVAELEGVRIGGPEFGGQVIIGTIRSVAESWATGRGKTEDGRYGSGGSYQRAFADVWVTQGGEERRVCGDPCNDKAVADTLNIVFGSKVRFTMPDPDPRWLPGTPKGYRGEVSLNGLDQLQFEVFSEEASGRLEVPALVITLSNDETKASRHVFWLAGVMTESKFGITCIFGLNQAGTGCDLPPVPGPTALTINLTDAPKEEGGEPLPGGRFALYQDANANQVLDPVTDLLANLEGIPVECTTAEDGTGDCVFEGLPPGDYLIHQLEAPDGYALAEDFPVTLLADLDLTVDLFNWPAIGFISISLGTVSDPPAPLAGGVFDLYQVAGSGSQQQKVAACATGADGKCQFKLATAFEDLAVTAECTLAEVESEGEVLLVVKDCTESDNGGFLIVPMGSYQVMQSKAPSGYQVADGAAFTLDAPLRHASLGFTNGLIGTDATAGTSTIIQAAPPAPKPTVASRPIQKGLVAFVRKVFDGFRFLLASPPQALLAAALWGFFCLPLVLALRRRWLPQT